MAILKALAVLAILLATATKGLATPTQVTVRVKAKDAKFIGTSLGGTLITIRNADTGELLAKGVTAGTTGSTGTIMEKPTRRGERLSDDKSAKFVANIDIDRPTLVEIKAYGPLAQRQAAGTVSVTQWLLPGKRITEGDGVLLEIPGFVVRVLAPPPHLKLSRGALPQKLALRAHVIMMCGCPVEPEGTWDANKIQVGALVTKNGRGVSDIRLVPAEHGSEFIGSLDIQEAGVYEVAVYAYDPSSGNTGVDTTTVVVE